MTVTRCDVSGSPAHAGISIQNSTQTAVVDNNCHDNPGDFFLRVGHRRNNTCHNNTTGIDIAGGNDNVVANNTCNNNAHGHPRRRLEQHDRVERDGHEFDGGHQFGREQQYVRG